MSGTTVANGRAAEIAAEIAAERAGQIRGLRLLADLLEKCPVEIPVADEFAVYIWSSMEPEHVAAIAAALNATVSVDGNNVDLSAQFAGLEFVLCYRGRAATSLFERKPVTVTQEELVLPPELAAREKPRS